MLTSHSQKPECLGLFILTGVLSGARQVFQLQGLIESEWVTFCDSDGTVVYLLVGRIRAGQEAVTMVWRYFQVTVDVQIMAREGHEHSVFQ